jgi:nucleoside-diphosphate-sugar epimerase
MTRALVLGARGFIGRNLVRTLTARGWEVEAPDRRVDLCEAAARAMQCGPVDYIFHAADVSGNVSWSKDHAGEQFLRTSRMAVGILDAWRNEQPQARLIGFSSLWAYPHALLDVRESDYWNGAMAAAVEHYGVVKKLLGVGIAAMRRQWGMRGTMLVLGNVYGPDDTSQRLIPSLVSRMRSAGDELEIYSDGHESRDFVYIDDQIEGILRHVDYDGDLLNVTAGGSHTVRQVVETLAQLMGYRGRIVYRPIGEPTTSRCTHVDRASAVTGWPAGVKLHSLQDGLRKTLGLS